MCIHSFISHVCLCVCNGCDSGVLQRLRKVISRQSNRVNSLKQRQTLELVAFHSRVSILMIAGARPYTCEGKPLHSQVAFK